MYEIIGKQIKQRRLQKRKSVAWMADRMGLTARRIEQIESGWPTPLANYIRLADILKYRLSRWIAVAEKHQIASQTGS